MAWLLTAAMMAGNSSFPVLAQEMPEIMLIDEENLSDSIPASGSEAAHSHDSIEIEGISTVADPGLTEAGLESESETESETETETETEIETETETGTETETETETQNWAELEMTEAETETQTEAAADDEEVTNAYETEAEPESEELTETAAELESEELTETAVEPETEALTEAAETATEETSEPEASETEEVTESSETEMPELTERETELETETEPESETESATEFDAETEDEAAPLTIEPEEAQPAAQQGYPVYFEGLRGDDYSWVFNTEDTSFTLNMDSLDGVENVTVKWYVGLWSEEESCVPDPLSPDDGYYEINGTTITLHGAKLAELYGDSKGVNWPNIGAEVFVDDEAASCAWTGVEIREEAFDYDYPLSQTGDNILLQGTGASWLSSSFSCWVHNPDHPDGEDVQIPITSARVAAQYRWSEESNSWENTSDEILRCEGDAGSGWNLTGIDYGRADLELTYTSVEDGEKTYLVEMYVNGEKYSVDIGFPEGTHQMLPGETLEIPISVYLDRLDENGQFVSERIRDYFLSVESENGRTYDSDVFDVSCGQTDENGTAILRVTSKREDVSHIYLRIMRTDENGESYEACAANIGIDVTAGYYFIEPVRLTDDDGTVCRVPIGGALDLNAFEPTLYRKTTDLQEKQAVTEGIRFTLEYDTNSWEEAGESSGGALPVLRRTGYDTHLVLIAQQQRTEDNGEPSLDDGGNEIWDEICRRDYWPDQMECNIFFEDLRDEDSTWVFDDEDLTIPLNTEKVDGLENTEITWRVGTWDESLGDIGETLDPNGGYYTVNEDGTAITLHGAALSTIYNEEAGNTWFHISAEVKTGGYTLCGTGTGVEVRRSVYDYRMPGSNPGERNLLPVDSFHINPQLECYVENAEHPYGETVTTPVTGLQILGQFTWDEDGNEITTDETIAALSGNSEEGWDLQGATIGFVKLRLTYDSVKEGEGTLVYGENPEDEFRVDFNGDVYQLSLEYPERSDLALLTNGEMVVTARLSHRYVNEEDGNWIFHHENISDYRLETIVNEDGTPGYDTNLLANVETRVDENGMPYVYLQAKDQEGASELYVRAMMADESGNYNEVCGAILYFNVNRSYYYLDPGQLRNEDGTLYNVQIGQTLDLNAFNPKVYRADVEKEDREEVTGELQYFIEYDTNAWQEQESDGAIPVLKRIGNWDTGVTLIAQQKRMEEDGTISVDDDGNEIWEEICRTEYWFDWSWEGGIWFEGLREEDPTWVFDDEDLTIPLNTEELNGLENTEITWRVGTWDESLGDIGETLDPNGGYYTVNEDGTAITLHGAALSSIYNEEAGNTWFHISAEVKTDGYTLCGTGTGVEVRGSIYDYHFPADQPGERNILPVQSFWIDPHMSCYVENAEHPYGDELETAITDVQILGQYTWNEDGEEVETDERIAELYGNSGNGWELRGDKLGFVKLKLTYDSVKEGEGSLTLGETPEEEFRVNVLGEVYHLDFDYPDAIDCMLTDSTIEVGSNLWAEYVEDENGAWTYSSKEISDYRLVIPDGYNTDLLEKAEIETDSEGRPFVRITSKKENGSDRFCVQAYLPDENGAYTVDAIGAQLNINVGEDYWYLSPAELADADGTPYTPGLGDVLDLHEFDPLLWYRSIEQNDPVAVTDHVRFVVEYDENAWEELKMESDGIPQLRRTTNWYTEICLVAQVQRFEDDGTPSVDEDGNEIWEERTRRNYSIGEKEYSGELEHAYGERQDEIHEDEEIRCILLTDEEFPQILTIVDADWMENLEGCTTTWRIAKWNGEEDVEADCAEIVESNDTSVTIRGLEGHEDEWLNVYATVSWNGIEVEEFWTRLYLTKCEHSWELDRMLQEPTCTKAGTAVYRCSGICGIEKVEEVEALGHIWDEGSITKEATCTANGTKTYTCTRSGCGEKKTETITKLGHSYEENYTVDKEATCAEAGSKSRHCVRCDAKTGVRTIKALGHKWNSGKITTAATCTRKGIRTYTCTVCKATKKESIAAKGHKWSAWKTTAEATVFAPEKQQRSCTVCKVKQSRNVGKKLTPTMKLNASSLQMKVKQTTTALAVSGMANGDSLKSVVSSNTAIVKVSEVKATGTFRLTAQKKAGSATLTITLKSGLSKKVKVTVKTTTIKTTKITVPTKVTMKARAKVTLTPILTPITSQEKITYATLDSKIVTVTSKGVVTAKKKGSGRILVRSGAVAVIVYVTVK